MRILGSIILPSPALMEAFDPPIVGRCAVKSSVTNRSGTKAYFKSLRISFQRGVLVSLGLDQHIEDLDFGVNCPPEIDHAAADFQIDLVEIPSRMRLQTTLSQGGPRSSVRNASPNAERSRRTRPHHVPPTNLRRRAG